MFADALRHRLAHLHHGLFDGDGVGHDIGATVALDHDALQAEQTRPNVLPGIDLGAIGYQHRKRHGADLGFQLRTPEFLLLVMADHARHARAVLERYVADVAVAHHYVDVAAV